MPAVRYTDLEHFEMKHVPDPNSGCFIWTGNVDLEGYGRLTRGPGVSIKAHRLAYQLFKGPIPEGMIVCHKCDNPTCVNPAHLYAGTFQDNVGDCLRRGRFRAGGKPHPGERNGRAKLTEVQALSIIDRYGAGEKASKLAKEFGMTTGAVHRLLKGTSWKCLSRKSTKTEQN